MAGYRNYRDAIQRKPTRWWHEALVDDMLMYPKCLMADRAKRLKYSESYLSLIMNSDMFKALYTRRRAEYSAALDAGIQHKLGMAANKALDIMMETLDTKRNSIPFPALADFADTTLERLGYGTKSAAVQVNINTPPLITQEQLAEARATLRAVETQRTIEHKPNELPPTPPNLRVVGKEDE